MSKFITIRLSQSALVSIFAEKAGEIMGAAMAIKAMKAAHELLPSGKPSAYIYNAISALRMEYPVLNWMVSYDTVRFEYKGKEEEILPILREVYKQSTGVFFGLVGGLGMAIKRGQAEVI